MNEDVISRLLATLHDRAPQPARNKAEPIQKFLAPREILTLVETVTPAVANVSSFKWGGTGYTAGWTWGNGQWKAYDAYAISPGFMAGWPT